MRRRNRAFVLTGGSGSRVCVDAGQLPEEVTEPRPESCFVETREDVAKVFVIEKRDPPACGAREEEEQRSALSLNFTSLRVMASKHRPPADRGKVVAERS